MTISCTCPKCGQLCGFKDVYAGHRARCLQCSNAFIIPNQDGDIGQPLPTEPPAPLPGFYRAVLKENFKAFIQRESFFATHSEANSSSAAMLAARLVAVFSTLFAMRTIGLYARHYFDCFPELKVPEY